MRKRLLGLALALLVAVLPVLSFAEAADRYDAVFDTAGDAGLLTARFLSLMPTSDDKQGDCTVLTSPDGLVMVVDAGETSSGPQVVAALRAMGVERIDFLIASHPHVDHVGGFPDILRAFEIGAVYTTAVVYPTGTYQAYIDEIAAQGIEHVILAEGDMFDFGSGVRAEVFHPGREITYYDGYPDNSTQFINNLSMVLKLTYGESTILFAGDLYTGAEKEVLEKHAAALSADVLKMTHHGAVTSSSKAWRTAVGADIAVAMHDAIADLGVLKKFHREGTDVYHTFVDGAVKVWTAGDGHWNVLTQRDADKGFLE